MMRHAFALRHCATDTRCGYPAEITTVLMAGFRTNQIGRHSSHTAAELAANSDLRWIVERGFELCAQNVLDLAVLEKALCEDLRQLEQFSAFIDDHLLRTAG